MTHSNRKEQKVALEDQNTAGEQKKAEARAGNPVDASKEKAGCGGCQQEAADSEKKGTDETVEAPAKEAEADRESGEENAKEAEASGAEEEPESLDPELEKAVKFRMEKFEKEKAELKDQYLRLYAEFDNFRKRTEKEKSQMFDMGAQSVIEKLLPVVDNFERALGSLSEEERSTPFGKGVDGIYRQIEKMFEDLEIKPIKAEGEKFDPNLHNAVMTDTESDAEEDTITQDLQKGYTYHGRVVRHSMVKVKK